MKDTIKDLGIMVFTGASAIMGMIAGFIIFKPKSITFNKKEKEDAK